MVVQKLADEAAAAKEREEKEGAASWWLHDVNVNVQPGQLVAVVGRVGSGKSSLVAALLGEVWSLVSIAFIVRSELTCMSDFASVRGGSMWHPQSIIDVVRFDFRWSGPRGVSRWAAAWHTSHSKPGSSTTR
jgi:ABC-type ATPase with predicted acetyltransferase domain